MGLIVGLHAFALWRITHVQIEAPPPPPTVLQVSMVQPPDEPPPPEPPKPQPRIQPKTTQKVTQQVMQDLPPVITDIPVADPIPEPAPAPPAPPTPPQPAKSGAGGYLVVKEQVKPIYPRKALREGIEGKVLVLITVDEKGVPQEAKVVKSSGNFELDNAAKNAVMKSLFVPQMVNGVAVRSQGLQEIVFKLSEG